ncbi:MAG: YicC/YloC family endoribonuclease [Anaerohalosphaeraceae bacterium]
MISSMTGFGQACAEIEGVVYTVEVRSVNNRYFKATLRLPDIAAFLEGEIEKQMRDSIQRGTLNYSLRLKNVSGQALFDIDENTLNSYVERLRRLVPEGATQCTIDLAAMLGLPGIVQPIIPDAVHIERMKSTILKLTSEALEQLKLSRLEEGRALAEDLLGHCRKMRNDLELIGQRKDAVVREYHEKLRKRVEELLSQAQLRIDNDLLAREVAIYADRSDINEEITRLDSHVTQFESCCQKGDAVGRRLDFITQEMLREANTIASKASDATIAQCVIDIKCAIDRVKEQVQNIE